MSGTSIADGMQYAGTCPVGYASSTEAFPFLLSATDTSISYAVLGTHAVSGTDIRIRYALPGIGIAIYYAVLGTDTSDTAPLLLCEARTDTTPCPYICSAKSGTTLVRFGALTWVLGVRGVVYVSEVQNSLLKEPRISKNIPTVAKCTQVTPQPSHSAHRSRARYAPL
eukprot:783470-Rhodomonas_salina.3